jgi:hypothetical protein
MNMPGAQPNGLHPKDFEVRERRQSRPKHLFFQGRASVPAVRQPKTLYLYATGGNSSELDMVSPELHNRLMASISPCQIGLISVRF